ncbi:MAG: exodeoxyribonuclease VII small subunit [Bdellovibrionota bacterium]|jgi:exodeoxyribonuclease VII small subunit|nr:exodeoxyribonuclease VII small subunit [Bdellovibrionota bacterium]
MSKTKESFEESLNSLEKIVTDLESQELDLEKSLEMFEKGVGLYKDCKKHLEKVEKKVAKLTESLEEEEIDD